METETPAQQLRHRRIKSFQSAKRSTKTPGSVSSSYSTTAAVYKYSHSSSTTLWELDRWSIVLGIIIVVHIVGAPFTKVEESFHMQAMHDILYHQTDLDSYDHKKFPGPVPRSFVGPLLVSGMASMLASVLTWRMLPKLMVQYVLRVCIGFMGWAAIARFRNAIHWRFGYSTSKYFAIILATVPHVLFYISRPLGNNLALITVLFGLANWVENERTTVAHHEQDGHPYSENSKEDRCCFAIIWMTLATVFFRCDVAVLLVPVCLIMLHKRQIGLGNLFMVGLTTGLVGIAVSVAIDSIFWGRLVWPEGVVLLFNTVENKSSQWGVEAWHWYFSHALPKALLSGILFFPVGLLWSRKGRIQAKLDKITAPFALAGLMFVALYSYLPHKELRFLFPGLPLLIMVAANGIAKFTMQNTPAYRVKASNQQTPVRSRRSSSVDSVDVDGSVTSSTKSRYPFGQALRVAAVVIVLCLNAGVSTVFSVASSWNYPGGYALQHAHDIQDKQVLQTEQRREKEEDRPGEDLLQNSTVFPWPVPIPPSPVFHHPYDSQNHPPTNSVNMFIPGGLKSSHYRVHIGVEAAMTGITRFGQRGWPWKYDKQEDIHPGKKFVGDSPFGFVLTGDDECARNGWYVAHVENGYDGLNKEAAVMILKNALTDIANASLHLVKPTEQHLGERITQWIHALKQNTYNIIMLPRSIIRLRPQIYVCQKL